MNWNKIYALSLRHIYLIKGSFPRILDLIYWPTIQIFLWGFISKFFTLTSSYYSNTLGVILSAAILYDFLFRSSISYNMMFLEIIAKVLPLVYIFEELRNILINNIVNYQAIILSIAISIIYFIAGILVFYFAYFGAKKRGTLINMGE